MLEHIFLLLGTAIAAGACSYSNHRVSEESRGFGPLLLFVPIMLATSSIYLSFDTVKHLNNLSFAFNNYWYVFLMYAPLVLLSNWFRMQGLFRNNYQSSMTLVNLSILFSAFIEVIIFKNTVSTGIMFGTFLVIASGFLIHGKGSDIKFTLSSLFIVFHCALAATNRNVDYYLISEGLNVFDIAIFQQLIIIPLYVLIFRKEIKGSLPHVFKDRHALLSMFFVVLALFVSFELVVQYGPTECFLAISAGNLISGVIENHKSMNMHHVRSYGTASLTVLAVCLVIFY